MSEHKGKVRVILENGNPLLLQRSHAVGVDEISSDAVQILVTDLTDIMYNAQGIGISAPQVGELLRVVVFYIPETENLSGVPLTVLINPQINPIDEERTEDYEGCLSIPGKRGKVSRYNKIRYTGLDQNGQLVDRVADGWHARIVQHECDHLDGILYPQLMEENFFLDGWINPLLSKC